MGFEAKHLEALKNCYLVKPDLKRARDFLCFRHGKFEDVDVALDYTTSLPALYLRRTSRDEFLALLREVEIALRKARITSVSSLLAEAVLVLCIGYRSTNRRFTLDEIIADYTEVKAISFIGIPIMAVMASDVEGFMLGIKVGRFTIGGPANFEHDRLFKESGKSNGGERTNLPRPGAWVMSEPISCRVLNAAFDPVLPELFRQMYLGAAVSDISKNTKSELEVDLSVPCALGAAVIDTEAIFGLEDLHLDVSFGGLGNSSFVVVNFGAGRSLPDSLREVGQRDAVARRIIGDKPLGECPDIDRLFGAFSRFLFKARSHDTGGRASEAFIHCVFALDLVLGGEKGESTTKNVKRRAAAIFCAATSDPFKAAEEQLSELYDLRSRYVHSGQEVSQDKFDLLIKICAEVAQCLLRARHTPLAKQKDFIAKHWYPRLDLVVAAMNAGVDLGNASLYTECGLAEPQPQKSPRLVH